MSLDPYLVLQVTENDGDAIIRQAYLAAVKNNPPEHNPERFREINEAYEILKNEKSRAEYELFTDDPGMGSPIEAVMQAHICQPHTQRIPPSFNALKEYLNKCSKLI